MDTLTKTIVEEVIKDLEIAEEYAKKKAEENYPKEHLHQVYAEMGYLKGILNVSKIKLESLKYIYNVFESPAGNKDKEKEEIQSEVNQGIVLSKEAAFENRDIYLKASWGKNYFYGIEITLKGTKDKNGEDLTFYWDNDHWLYNLATEDKEAIEDAKEDLTERETLFVITFLKELVDRGVLKGKEEEEKESTSSFTPPDSIPLVKITGGGHTESTGFDAHGRNLKDRED